jgi:hypothetical protein
MSSSYTTRIDYTITKLLCKKSPSQQKIKQHRKYWKMRKSINKNLKENEKIVEIWVEGTIHGLWEVF